MAKVSIRYLVTRKNSDGTARHYWQPDSSLRASNWKMTRLSDAWHEAVQQAEEINKSVDNWRAGNLESPTNHKPGSMDALIADYRNSRRFAELRPGTKRDYNTYLDMIAQWAGEAPARVIDAPMVQDLYEKNRKAHPRKAAYLIQVLRLLFTHAERAGFIPKNSNPATKPGMSYQAPKATLWTPDQVTHFVATADSMPFDYFSIGTAVMLNEWLGQRRGDIVRLQDAAYRNGTIHIAQSKTSAEVALPVDMVPHLKARLEEQVTRNRARACSSSQLIQQAAGGAYTADGFMSAFECVRREATKTMPDMEKQIFKNLRHTAVTRLAEAGCEVPLIAAVTGHSFQTCQDIIDRYNIRTTAMARQAFARRLAAAHQTPAPPKSQEVA